MASTPLSHIPWPEPKWSFPEDYRSTHQERIEKRLEKQIHRYETSGFKTTRALEVTKKVIMVSGIALGLLAGIALSSYVLSPPQFIAQALEWMGSSVATGVGVSGGVAAFILLVGTSFAIHSRKQEHKLRKIAYSLLKNRSIHPLSEEDILSIDPRLKSDMMKDFENRFEKFRNRKKNLSLGVDSYERAVLRADVDTHQTTLKMRITKVLAGFTELPGKQEKEKAFIPDSFLSSLYQSKFNIDSIPKDSSDIQRSLEGKLIYLRQTLDALHGEGQEIYEKYSFLPQEYAEWEAHRTFLEELREEVQNDPSTAFSSFLAKYESLLETQKNQIPPKVLAWIAKELVLIKERAEDDPFTALFALSIKYGRLWDHLLKNWIEAFLPNQLKATQELLEKMKNGHSFQKYEKEYQSCVEEFKQLKNKIDSIDSKTAYEASCITLKNFTWKYFEGDKNHKPLLARVNKFSNRVHFLSCTRAVFTQRIYPVDIEPSSDSDEIAFDKPLLRKFKAEEIAINKMLQKTDKQLVRLYHVKRYILKILVSLVIAVVSTLWWYYPSNPYLFFAADAIFFASVLGHVALSRRISKVEKRKDALKLERARVGAVSIGEVAGDHERLQRLKRLEAELGLEGTGRTAAHLVVDEKYKDFKLPKIPKGRSLEEMKKRLDSLQAEKKRLDLVEDESATPEEIFEEIQDTIDQLDQEEHAERIQNLKRLRSILSEEEKLKEKIELDEWISNIKVSSVHSEKSEKAQDEYAALAAKRALSEQHQVEIISPQFLPLFPDAEGDLDTSEMDEKLDKLEDDRTQLETEKQRTFGMFLAEYRRSLQLKSYQKLCRDYEVLITQKQTLLENKLKKDFKPTREIKVLEKKAHLLEGEIQKRRKALDHHHRYLYCRIRDYETKFREEIKSDWIDKYRSFLAQKEALFHQELQELLDKKLPSLRKTQNVDTTQ